MYDFLNRDVCVCDSVKNYKREPAHGAFVHMSLFTLAVEHGPFGYLLGLVIDRINSFICDSLANVVDVVILNLKKLTSGARQPFKRLLLLLWHVLVFLQGSKRAYLRVR